MDGNKDDALKCLKIGKQALESGDRNRALKFLAKARRLDPTLPIDDLLSAAEGTAAAESNPNSRVETPAATPEVRSSGSSPKSSANDQPSVRRRVSAAEPSSSSSSGSYTEEQITLVREIRRKKNYYEILGLEKSCTVEDVRKAYRKLSLKVHPDKNKAPGAEEAFKSVSKAFQCLSNDENRRKYDLAGEDESLFEQRAAARPGPRAYRHGSYPYEFRFITPKGVHYYVKSSKFNEVYPIGSTERTALEERVESEYISILRQNCRLEVQRHQWGYIREKPHCEMLQKFDSVN
ncbi:hypothetical protein PIB30_004927 [Stylosanthes scabra]|uniref:J domain-containing protein n=1 Tax=Stylosanthes scabra TaxID=79078 RepID=A0ABU6W725_9FABA|nr:hypothetical protein [Stylosanthes scabra]